jgi:type I restriction enzyme S subunit
MEEIKTYKLEDISVGKGCYGIAASAIPYSHNKRTYLRITDINDDGSINLSGLMSVEDENADKFLLNPNDIVFARTGNSTGRSYFYDGSVGPLVYAGFLIKFSLDKTKVNPRILKYYTHSQKYYDWVHSFDTGGTRGNINAKTYGEMPIDLPPIETQNRIVSILKSLDDKIELNKRINDNLEQQAQALFKSWFVDFEPFKDGKFVDSELGMIPEGWKVGTFSDIILSTIGGDWGKDSLLGNYSKEVFCIRGADIPEIRKGNKGKMPTRFILEKNYLSKALEPDNIVVEISGGSPTQSTGRICIISDELKQKYNNSLICTNFCRAIKPYNGYASYIYYLWDMLYNKGVMFLYENGTTGIKNFDINGFIEKEQIIIPTKEVTERFAHTIELLSKQIQQKGTETESLVNIRDSLLPKLMSGELKIKDLNN